MNKFLILSTPRSGSHLLLSSIQSYYKNLLDLDEIIHESRIGIIDRNSAIESFKSELSKENSISIIHAYQISLWYIDNIFMSNIINQNNIKTFLLIRKNKLEKFLSLILAEKNNTFHTSDDNYSHKKKVIFNKQNFLDFCEQETLNNKFIFEKASFISNIQVVYYEDMIKFGGFFLDNFFIKLSNDRFKKIIRKDNLKGYVIFESEDDEKYFDEKLIEI
jgi:hypothetical protein